jgi:hypothetical protein
MAWMMERMTKAVMAMKKNGGGRGGGDGNNERT